MKAFRCYCRQVAYSQPSYLLSPSKLIPHDADIKALTVSDPSIVDDLGPAFQKYNEDQLITVKLPGSSEAVIVSSYNSLGDGRYYDVEKASSFEFDHATQKASGVQSYSPESKNIELVYVADQWELDQVCTEIGMQC